MSRPEQRITLILADQSNPAIDWNYGRPAALQIAFPASVEALRQTIRRAARDDGGLDVERIVIDRMGTAQDFLDCLTAVPTRFLGDVVFIARDGSAYLSAMARGDGRILHRLGRQDLRFYLEMHELVTGRTPKASIASEARA